MSAPRPHLDSRSAGATLLLIVLLGTGVRLLPLALPFDWSGPDSVGYLEPARSLAAQGAYLDAQGHPTAARPPGYPTFLAAILWVTGDSLFAVRAVQALLGGLVAAMVFLLLRRGADRRTALAGGLLTALDPIAIGQSPFILREGLLLALSMALVLCLTALRGRRRALLAGLLLAALALTHQLYVLLLGFLVAAEVVASRRKLRGSRLLPWLAMGLVVILAVFLWARRTERVLGRFSMTATANAVPARELWLSTACDNTWLSGDHVTGFQALAFAEERRLVDAHGVEAAKSIYYWRTWANWRDHPLRSLGRLLRLNFWYWAEIPGAVRLAEHPRLKVARWGLLPFHWIRLACALLGVWFLVRSRRWRPYRYVLAVLLFFALAPALLYPVPRYLGPAAPLLSVLAVLGLRAVWPAREASP